jgi:hypothetical protein
MKQGAVTEEVAAPFCFYTFKSAGECQYKVNFWNDY